MNFNNAWININNKCNLNCVWCYKEQGSKYISLKAFIHLISILNGLGIENLTLIGGEPTLHIQYFEFLEILKDKQYIIATNGIQFHKNDFLKKSIDYGLEKISLSIKGYSKYSFYKTTGINEFSKFNLSLDHLSKSSLKISYSYILSNIENIDIIEFSSFLNSNGIKRILISDTRPYIRNELIIKPSPCNFEELYYELLNQNIDVYIRPNHPFCHYKTEFIESLLKEKRLISQCILRKGGGLFFNEDLDLLLCNEFCNEVIGKFKTDFIDALSLKKHIEILDSTLFKPLCNCSSIECKECTYESECGGNCLLNWI